MRSHISTPMDIELLETEEKATQPLQIHADRLIIATNRGPVEYYVNRNDTLKYRRGAGGVVTALIDAGNRMDVTWVAMAMTEGDRRALRESEQQNGLLQSPLRGQKMQLRYVTISKAAYRKHYERISNQVLWFLQHYLYDPTEDSSSVRRIQDAWTNGYCVANQAIADAVSQEIDREDSSAVVMLHDYHLYLAPGIIRKEHPNVVIQQFIHIPWPDVRCWHFLPSNIAQAIFSGLIGNDIIGFQTDRDAHNFLEGARTLLDGVDVDFEDGIIWMDGRKILVRSYPISISVTGERRAAQSIAGKHAAEKIQSLIGDPNDPHRMKAIMRVDRMEPTKNIIRGYQAYALLFETHPELIGKVTFLSFLVPSRQALLTYQRYKADVLKLIAEINLKYGSDTWTPIHVFCENDRTRALAAMQLYDVLLVNPIIDGMNLVVKEGAVVNRNNGVLVLSRTVGAFQELGKFAVPTSPTNVEETAQALYKALTMSEEERCMNSTMLRRVVERNDLNKWLTLQIRDLNRLLDHPILAIEDAETPSLPLMASVR